MTEQLTVEQAQAAMDAAVAAKTASERKYKSQMQALDTQLDEDIRAARVAHDLNVTRLRKERAESLKAHRATIARAGALVRRASQAESRAKAEARAAEGQVTQ